ncbi:MAG: 3-phosphoshikimate 1-carboxyvinyltransferase [Planctomycetota bacterium]
MSSQSISPLRLPFDAELRLPGSKSEANRAIVVAALCKGITRISNATPCDDVRYLVDGLKTLGFDLEWLDQSAGELEVRGGLPKAAHAARTSGEIYCGNAGTAMRFLTSVAILVPGEWLLNGDRRMSTRPIQDLVDAWASLGVEIEARAGCPPIRVKGGLTRGGEVRLDASKSSQFLSSMLLVGWQLKGGLAVQITKGLASASYLELTTEVLKHFGIGTAMTEEHAAVCHTEGQSLGRDPFEIEGDWSAAGTFFALAHLSNSRFLGSNLRPDSTQSDRAVLHHLQALSGRGDLEIDVSNTPDQLMNLALVAARRSGRTRFVGAANLRLKECDRLAVTAREFTRMGIEIAVEPDGISIQGSSRVQAVAFDPEGDHRLAMVGALFGCLAPGMQVSNADCVAKSYPRFFDDLTSICNQTRPLAIVGMRATGKSTLARLIAEILNLEFVDSDSVFEFRAGEIRRHVEKEGWPSFRRAEEAIIAEELRPGVILATGGGAVESESTRAILKKKAAVIWITEELATIGGRLRADSQGRPALSDTGLLPELESALDRRAPFYEDVADIILPPGLSSNEQIGILVEELRRSCTW